MGKTHDNKIPTQLGFKYLERKVADDRTEVQSLEDLKTLVVPPHFVTFVRDILDENGLPTGYMWNGQDQTNLANWINPLALLKAQVAAYANGDGKTFTSLGTGVGEAMEAPVPADGIPFRIENLVPTADDGRYVYASGEVDGYKKVGSIATIKSEPLDKTDDVNTYTGKRFADYLALETEATPTQGSTKFVQSGGVYSDTIWRVEYEKRKEVVSDNLFDKTKFVANSTLSTDPDNPITLGTGSLNTIIPIAVKEGEEFTRSSSDLSWWLDGDMKGVGSRLPYVEGATTITAPSGAKYFTTVLSDFGLTAYQFVKAASLPAYDEFVENKNTEDIADIDTRLTSAESIVSTNTSNTSTNTSNISTLDDRITNLEDNETALNNWSIALEQSQNVVSENLFDKTKRVRNSTLSVDENNPITLNTGSLNTIKPIPVVEGQNYTRQISDIAWWLDEHFKGVGSRLSGNGSVETLTAPTGAKYFVCALSDFRVAGFMFVNGDALPSTYDAFNNETEENDNRDIWLRAIEKRNASANLYEQKNLLKNKTISGSSSEYVNTPIIEGTSSQNVIVIPLKKGETIVRSTDDIGHLLDINMNTYDAIGSGESTTKTAATDGYIALYIPSSQMADFSIYLDTPEENKKTEIINSLAENNYREVAELQRGTLAIAPVFKIPFFQTNEFTLEFKFKLENDFNASASEKRIARLLDYEGNVVFDFNIKSELPTVGHFYPTYNSNFVADCLGSSNITQGYTNLMEILNNNCLGDSLFSIRKLNADINDVDLRVKISGGYIYFYDDTTLITSHQLTGSLISLLDTLDADSNLSDYEFIRFNTADYQAYEIQETEFYLVKSIAEHSLADGTATGQTIYDNPPCVLYKNGVDIEHIFKVTYKDNNFHFYIDGFYFYRKYSSVFKPFFPATLYLGGDENGVTTNDSEATFSDLKITEGYQQEPYILTTMGHFIVDGEETDGQVPPNAPGGFEFTVTRGRMQKFIKACEDAGLPSLSMKEAVDIRLGNAPKKSGWVNLWDDNQIEHYTELKFRRLFASKGVKNEVCLQLDSIPRPINAAFISNLRKMQNLGWDFHYHTGAHYNVTLFSYDQITTQIAADRTALAAYDIDFDIWTYAYGDNDKKIRHSAKNFWGIKAAFNTIGPSGYFGQELFDLPRLRIDDKNSWSNVEKFIKGELQAY